MIYKVKIGSDIILEDEKGNEIIETFKYMLNSIQDDSEERDPKARAEFTVTGKITDKNCGVLHKLIEWSKDTDDVYRDIEISVYWNQQKSDKAIRVFKFDRVFCVDYSENYTQNANETKFTLFMAQSPTGKKQDVICEFNDVE